MYRTTRYKRDREFSDRYISAIKRIVGSQFVDEAPLKMDLEEAADLIVMQREDKTIACRVRRNTAAKDYARDYPWEFTIRSSLDSGQVTEWEKLRQGYGDWMFYGHVNRDGSLDFQRWFLVDLAIYRASIVISRLKIPGEYHYIKCAHRSNGDGTYFRAYDLRDFLLSDIARRAGPILVAASHYPTDADLRERRALLSIPGHPRRVSADRKDLEQMAFNWET